jgi:rRNA maturation RNase YbeY
VRTPGGIGRGGFFGFEKGEEVNLRWYEKRASSVLIFGLWAKALLGILQFKGLRMSAGTLARRPKAVTLGDLVFCPDVVKEEALREGLSYRAYLSYLVLNGVLPLLGYDHEKSKVREWEMYQIQDELSERFNPRVIKEVKGL